MSPSADVRERAPATPPAGPSEDPAPPKTTELLLLGVCFGLLAGVTEAVICAVKAHFRLVFVSAMAAHYQWMPAVAYGPLFGLLGCAVALGRWILPQSWWARIGRRSALVLCGSLYFLINLNHLDAILRWGTAGYAEAILALGLAVACFSPLARRPATLRRLARWGTVALAAIVVLWTALDRGQHWAKERQMLAELPPVAAKRPNVLWIVWDTVRANSVSLYGYRRPTTPTLEQLANSSLVFEQAIATAPWTAPSHAGMFTGYHLHQLPDLRQGAVPEQLTTLAEVLHEQGYLTAGFVGNLEHCNRHTGLAQGFAHYADDPVSLPRLLETVRLSRLLRTRCPAYRDLLITWWGPWSKPAKRVNAELLRWLAQRPPGRPFFIFANYIDAHDPYLPPPPFDRRWGPHTRGQRRMLEDWRWYATIEQQASPAEIETALKAYDGCIAQLDHQLDVLLSELRRRGELEDTLLIVTSDHGEQFGEHRLFWHGTSLHQPQIHVPLLLRLPGQVPAGQRIHQAVSLAELPATVLDVLGRSDSRLPGRSLLRYTRPQPSDSSSPERVPSVPVMAGLRQFPWDQLPSHYPNAAGSVFALWVGQRKYIRSQSGGAEELYDLAQDPAEMHNLAAAAQPTTLSGLRRHLDQLLAGRNQPNPPAVAAAARRSEATRH